MRRRAIFAFYRSGSEKHCNDPRVKGISSFLKTRSEGIFADKGDVIKILSTIKRYDFKGNHNVLLKTDFFIIEDYLEGPNIVDI